MKSAMLSMLLCTALLLTGCQQAAPPSSATADPAQVVPEEPSVVAGEEAQPPAGNANETVELKIVSFDEAQELIAGYRGKVVVLDIWSTACPPCLKEFPGLVALHNKYSRDDVVCVSLSLDYEGIPKMPPESYRELVLGRLEQFGATFDNLLMNEDSDAMLEKLKLGAPPAVEVYNRAGEKVKRFTEGESGFTYAADVAPLVAELVAQEPEEPASGGR